nr:MAG: Prophage endopeptidase tail [Bacteriophage sp.]
MILQIKRGNRVIAESADFSYSPSLQEVRKLTCEVVSVVPIEFKAYNSKSESEYDTVVYNGNTFILYQAPSGDNLNEAGKYKYSLLFYGKEVLLQNVAFLDIVSGTGGEINKIRYTHGGLFQFWGDAKQLAARIEANIESYNASLGAGYTGIGTWTLNVDAEGELTEDMIDITDGTNLFEALKNFYDKFYLNYYFSTTANGGIITITDKTRPSVNWTFKQGDGGGAVKVSSSVDTSTPVITRIIPQGGSRNVPPEYKKDAKPADESRYCPYILLPNDSAGNIRYYIDSEYGLKNYGVRGKTISNTFSGIYPSIRGKKLGDLYPSGLPEWDTYKADGEPDPQSGKVAGEGASAATRIDKIIGSTPIKSDDSDSFFIYMTSPGFNLGYKVYEDGDSSDKINDNVQPQYKPHAMFDKYRDFESFDIYGTRAYYDQPVKVTATFSGKMLFSILPIGSDAVGKKVKINLRMVLNRVLGQASPLKEVVIGEEGATGMLEIPYDKTALVGYIEKGQNTTVTIRVEFTFDSDVPVGSCKIGFSEEMTCNIHFGNQDGSQDRFYYKYASVTDAVFSMRTGTYTGTEFKINKNGIIPLYGEVNGDTGETEEDVAMFNKGARYKISCYRTDSDNAKLPLYTDGKSPSIAAGTEFVILNIVMPESYVTMAENTLEKAALDYLSRYDHENRTVSLDISSGFVAEHPNLFIDFIEGNMLKVRDNGIGVFDFSDNGQIVDMQLQIQSLEIKYSKENMFPSYSCTIARRKILSFYERLAQENQTTSTQNTTNVTLGGSGTGSGTNIFSEQLLNDLIASFQKFNGWFEWDEENQALRCKSAFYTNQWISALGAQSGSGEPGGGDGGLIKAVYGFADLGKTFDDSNLSNTFNAYTINEIWKLAKEGGMNTDKLWQELGKDDPTKKIHISHIPDNKFVTLDTEQTVTASKIFTGQLSTANVVPSVNNASTLGLESKRWENIYAVDANISGTVKTQALQVGDIKIIYDSVNKAVTFEHIDGSTEIGFYTRGWISALGVSPGGSGGSGGDGLVKNVYGFSNLGTTFSDSDLDNTFNAYTINEIWKMAKEGGGIKNITQSGSGNAVTDMTLSSDGKTITAVFGETFARQQDLGTLNNTVTQLSNKLNNFLEGSDADNIINKWKELEAFLDGLTESDNLAELLALKADKTITISAGTGLTGGGNLSANRTLSLATTGVKAGTYTKVTVDTYGRVTVGDNPTTLAGYGITDAVTLTTAQTISGRKTFSQNIVFNNNGGITYPDGNVALRNSDGHTILASFGDGSINLRPNGHNNTKGAVWINKAGNVQAPSVSTNTITIGDAQLVYDSANKALRVKHRTDGNTVGFYSDGWVSALGVKTGGSGGGSGVIKTVYSFANLTDGTTFSDSDLDNTFNAYTIKKLYDMAGQGGLDADAMWAELKKADSSKIIDASHIPTSVLDGRWVKKAGDTMTGTLTSASTSGSIVFKGLENCDITNIYKDNGVIRDDDGGLTSIRNGLRFNWYDTYWYIGNLRGSSTDSAGFGVVDHNNKLVLRVTPNDVRAPRFMSTVATGLSPLIVSSNTVVGNLNADLLDGVHLAGLSGREGVMRSWLRGRYTTVNQYFGNGNVVTIDPKPTDDATLSANTTVLSLGDVPTRNTQLAFHYDTNTIKYRRHDDSKWNDWVVLIHSGNYAGYSDGRYVKKAGDTMTGDLAMDANKGFYFPHGTRVVKTSGNWIHDGGDTASSTDANLRFASWYGIGWYPTIDSTSGVRQGNNAMWLNVRTGVLDVHSNITSHNGYLAANWDSARRLVLGGGSSYAYIDSRNSSNNVLCNIVLKDNKVFIGNYAESSRFVSTVGTGTAPYQCSSTTLNTNLNADLLDNWHIMDIPRNYNSTATYSLQFALGGTDNGWKKIFACSESGAGPYRSVTVWGRIWYAYGNHAQEEVRYYHFCAIFQMRSAPSASDSNVGNVSNSARLYLPTFAKGMDNIRLVRVGTNNFELQVRQIGSYHNGHIQYQYWSSGANVSAWRGLQSTSNTSVAVSAGGASTLADSRASSADVWTSARTFYIQDHNAAHTGAGISVNGSSNVYLKLPSSIQCSDWFRSTGNSGWYHQNYGGGIYMEDSNFIRNYGSKRLLIQTDTYDTIRLVRTSGSGGSSIAFYNGGGTFRGQLGVNASSWFTFDTGTATANQNVVEISPAGGIHSKAEITAKASGSDIRLKKDIQNYNAMNIINRFRSVKYHWNDIAKANSEVYNNDYDQFGLIAQDLIAGGFEQWVRDVFHDYYTVTYERLIPVVWKGLQEVDDEVTRLKKRVRELENRLGIN